MVEKFECPAAWSSGFVSGEVAGGSAQVQGAWGPLCAQIGEHKLGAGLMAAERAPLGKGAGLPSPSRLRTKAAFGGKAGRWSGRVCVCGFADPCKGENASCENGQLGS